MSLIQTDFTRAPAFTLHTVLDRILSTFAELSAGLRAERQQADLRRELDGLDDHQLLDIGLEHKDIRSPLITGYEGFGLESRRR